MEYKVYESAQLRKYRDRWRGQLKYRDYTGTWTAEDGATFGTREEAAEYSKDSGLQKEPAPDFVWKSVSKVLDATGKKEARKKLDEWRAEMEELAQAEQPGVKEPGDVGEFVAQYIDTLEHSGAVERSTLTPYRAMHKHINAALHDVPYKKLDTDTAQAWVNGMVKDGYAPSTVKKALNLLKAAYSDAVRRQAIPYSPVEAVKAPKAAKKEPNSLGDDMRAKLLAYLEIAADTPVNLAIKIAINTGMREQEICGLRWKDVDLKAGVLHIRNVIGRDGGKTYEKMPKSGSSRRDVPVTPELAGLLQRRRIQMMEECMEAGVPLTNEHHVVGKVDGEYMRPHYLWSEWKAIAKSLGLVGMEGKPPTFHDLRHTFATAAIKSGADVKSVASILGHANAAMTLNVYANADAEAKRRAMERAAAEIAEAPKPAEILELGKTGTEE